MSNEFQQIAGQLIEAGRTLHALGMVPATSGNFSARLNGRTIAITVSGAHKGNLDKEDIMQINANGESKDGRQPSAETGLHLQLYMRLPEVNAIMHCHSQASTLFGKIVNNEVILKDYELFKAFEKVDTHEGRIVIPVFDNDQNIQRLVQCIDDYMDNHEAIRAYIIRGHGFYTWASTITVASRQCEALEFMLQCELKLKQLD